MASMSDVTDLNSCFENIVYFRFRCMIDGESVDKQVTHGVPLSFQFCLKLSQHIYDIRSDNYTIVSITPTPTNEMNVAILPMRSFGTDGNSTPPAISPIKFNPHMTSLAMIYCMSSSGNSKKTKKGYHSPLTFLDAQAEFNLTFGI